MDHRFDLTDDERSFLRHWSYEASDPFWGPASIWCRNCQVSPAYGPYPLAELYWAQEIEEGREGWVFERPAVPFRVPWRDLDQFWARTDAALALIPRLRGDPRFSRSAGFWPVEGRLTPEESNFLRTYNREMVSSGSGHSIDLARRRGVLNHHLIPFFVVLEDLYRDPEPSVAFPWPNFPARYEELSGREYDYPDWARRPR